MEHVKQLLRVATALLLVSVLVCLSWVVSTFVVMAMGSDYEIYGTITGKWSGELCYEPRHFERATTKVASGSGKSLYSYCSEHATSVPRMRLSRDATLALRLVGTVGSVAGPVFLFVSLLRYSSRNKGNGGISGYYHERDERPNGAVLTLAFLFTLVGPLVAAMA